MVRGRRDGCSSVECGVWREVEVLCCDLRVCAGIVGGMDGASDRPSHPSRMYAQCHVVYSRSRRVLSTARIAVLPGNYFSTEGGGMESSQLWSGIKCPACRRPNNQSHKVGMHIWIINPLPPELNACPDRRVVNHPRNQEKYLLIHPLRT